MVEQRRDQVVAEVRRDSPRSCSCEGRRAPRPRACPGGRHRASGRRRRRTGSWARIGARSGLAGIRVTDEAAGDRDDRMADQVGRDERRRGAPTIAGEGRERVRQAVDPRAVGPQHRRARRRAGSNAKPPRTVLTGMEPELERGHDPEVPAAASKAPQQVRVVAVPGPDHLPAGGHDLRADEVVAREAVSAQQPADAAAQGESRRRRSTGSGRPSSRGRAPPSRRPARAT